MLEKLDLACLGLAVIGVASGACVLLQNSLFTYIQAEGAERGWRVGLGWGGGGGKVCSAGVVVCSGRLDPHSNIARFDMSGGVSFRWLPTGVYHSRDAQAGLWQHDPHAHGRGPQHCDKSCPGSIGPVFASGSVGIMPSEP